MDMRLFDALAGAAEKAREAALAAALEVVTAYENPTKSKEIGF